jgi:hypothetical protein
MRPARAAADKARVSGTARRQAADHPARRARGAVQRAVWPGRTVLVNREPLSASSAARPSERASSSSGREAVSTPRVGLVGHEPGAGHRTAPSTKIRVGAQRRITQKAAASWRADAPIVAWSASDRLSGRKLALGHRPRRHLRATQGRSNSKARPPYPLAVAMTLASSVLPVPGGPWSSTPAGGGSPTARTRAASANGDLPARRSNTP